MADDGGNRTTPEGDDPGVLSSLPSTRPQRLGGRAREGAAAKPARPKAAGGAKGTRGAAAGTKAAATASKAEAAASKARPAKRATAKAPSASGGPIPLEQGDKRPQPVRAGHPRLKEPAEKAATQRVEEPVGQSGVDLVKTVIQAAGEVAQIGATLGGQVIKRAVDKLPKKP